METPDSTVVTRVWPPRPASDGHSESIPSAQPIVKHNQVGSVTLYGMPIVSLVMDNNERLCLAQISNTLLKAFSYNEIHNRRVALGITCVQCTPVQLEILRRAGAMPVSSRRCGMITKREAERLCKSFLGDNTPPALPEDFTFEVQHHCAWGCHGLFYPARYNSSRAKCIKCCLCSTFFSPNKFIFHSHRMADSSYVQPDAANFNSWRRHIRLLGDPAEEVVHAWEDVKAMFNGGSRKRPAPLEIATGPPKQARHNPSPNSSSSPLELTRSGYPDLMRPAPTLLPPPAPALQRLSAYKRFPTALEASSLAEYLWPGARWPDISALALSPAHLWPRRAPFTGFPLAAGSGILAGLVDYPVYPLSSVPAGSAAAAPQLFRPQLDTAGAAATAEARTDSSAFQPLRQPWLDTDRQLFFGSSIFPERKSTAGERAEEDKKPSTERLTPEPEVSVTIDLGTVKGHPASDAL